MNIYKNKSERIACFKDITEEEDSKIVEMSEIYEHCDASTYEMYLDQIKNNHLLRED